jgi:trk system potassium uptake protein TrkH
MNPRRVLHILGLLLLVIAAAELIPLIWCFEAGGAQAAPGFLVASGTSALLGGTFRIAGHAKGELYRRDGVLIVVGAWILASLTGAIPYWFSDVLPNPIDALFESASGFTTTGATVLRDIEAAGHPILFWRSFTQWLGGIGIVVLFVALLSELGPGARFLFKLEVPGPKAEVLHDRVQDTALALGRIYIFMSLAEIGVLLALGVGLFDALTHSFSTVSTGGFSPHTESIGLFSPLVRATITFFMAAAGVNFAHYYSLSLKSGATVVKDAELRSYLWIILGTTALIAVAIAHSTVGGSTPPAAAPSFLEIIGDALFQVVSIVSTTGFSTVDFDRWPDSARTLLIGLMIVGGCAGSTAGGFKISRALIAWRAATREVRLTYGPNSIIAVALGGESVPEETVRSAVALFFLWIVAWGAGALLLSIGEVDIITAGTASIATLSNVGPGLGQVGPTGDFAFFSGWQKVVMIFLMWLGRLEFFAVLALLHPKFWTR